MTSEPPTPATHADGTDPRPTLDADALARLRELDPDGRHGVLARVLAAYEASLGRALGQLQAARDAGDARAVAELAHKLKSSSASVGALALASSCAEIERRLRSGEAGDLRADVARMVVDGEAALRVVRAMLQP
jgi:HPt (histidine-containing phosphotransfer) domain-containing protein